MTFTASAPMGWLRPLGETGGLIAKKEWRMTSLGALESWPEELRVSTNLMLASASPMAVIWGPDFRIIYNDAHREIIGSKHPTSFGQPCGEVFSEIWTKLEPLFQQVMQGQSVVLQDLEFSLNRNGRTEQASFSGNYTPLRDSHQVVRGFLVSVVETTARIALERERAQTFDTTLSAIADFTYTFDTDGRFTYANKALLDLWGVELQDAVGKTFFELPYSPELAARLHEQIQSVITTRGRVVDETRYVSPSGVEGFYEYIFSPVFGPRGDVILIAGSTRNITVRKQLELRVQKTVNELEAAKLQLENNAAHLEKLVEERTARLRDTVAELESFSYSVSHDLRGPLRAVQTYAMALEEDCGAQLSNTGLDYLHRMVKASTRMDRLIQDVLVFSKITRGELPMERIELDDFVPGLIDSYPVLSRENADIEISFPLPAVLANEAFLTQCLSNLLVNAVKFVAPGVRPRVEIFGSTKNGRAFLCVRDNGIGIQESSQEKIFDAFQRLSTAYEGTGIGLAIVRKAAERMGGSITLDSAPGKGSAFTLELTAAR